MSITKIIYYAYRYFFTGMKLKNILAYFLILTVFGFVTKCHGGVYKYFGKFKSSDVMNDYCDQVGCSIHAPNEFFESDIYLSVFDTTLDRFYESLRLGYKENGWILTKKANKVFIKTDTLQMSYYIDYRNMLQSCEKQNLYLCKMADSLKRYEINKYNKATKDSLENVKDSLDRLDEINRMEIVYVLVSSKKTAEGGISWASQFASGTPWPPVLNYRWVASLSETTDSVLDKRNIVLDIDRSGTINWGQIVLRESVVESDKTITTTANEQRYGFSVTITQKKDSIFALQWDYTSPPPADYVSGSAIGKGEVCATGYVDIVSENVVGVPFLKDIPFIGQLFRHDIKSKTRSKLYVCAREQKNDTLESVMGESGTKKEPLRVLN